MITSSATLAQQTIQKYCDRLQRAYRRAVIDSSRCRARKVVKPRRCGSVAVETNFLSETKASHRARISAPATSFSANYPSYSSSSSHPHPTALNDNEEGLSDSRDCNEKIGAANSKPALYRDISTKARVTYCFRQIEASNSNTKPQAFTLRINPALLENEANPADYMRRRIDRELQNRLGRKITFAGVMEWRGENGNELHAHGLLGGVSEHEKQGAREALQAAGGRWRQGPGRGHQVDLQDAYNVDGWASYCSEDTRHTQAEIIRRREQMGVQSSRAPRVDFSSREIQRAAKALYEKDRAEFIAPSKPSPAVKESPAEITEAEIDEICSGLDEFFLGLDEPATPSAIEMHSRRRSDETNDHKHHHRALEVLDALDSFHIG